MAISLDQARKAKQHAEQVFHRHGEISGVGITRGTDGFALKVNFTQAPTDPGNLPTDVDGVPVQIDVVGRIRAQTQKSENDSSSRPASRKKAAPAHKG